MKITTSQLRQIIREEVSKENLNEALTPEIENAVATIEKAIINFELDRDTRAGVIDRLSSAVKKAIYLKGRQGKPADMSKQTAAKAQETKLARKKWDAIVDGIFDKLIPHENDQFRFLGHPCEYPDVQKAVMAVWQKNKKDFPADFESTASSTWGYGNKVGGCKALPIPTDKKQPRYKLSR